MFFYFSLFFFFAVSIFLMRKITKLWALISKALIMSILFSVAIHLIIYIDVGHFGKFAPISFIVAIFYGLTISILVGLVFYVVNKKDRQHRIR